MRRVSNELSCVRCYKGMPLSALLPAGVQHHVVCRQEEHSCRQAVRWMSIAQFAFDLKQLTFYKISICESKFAAQGGREGGCCAESAPRSCIYVHTCIHMVVKYPPALRRPGTSSKARRSHCSAAEYCWFLYVNTPSSLHARGSEGHTLCACTQKC